MLVHWAMPVFAKLVPKHILANLSEALCNPYLDFNSEVESLPCYNGITGNLLFSSPTPGARRVSRRLLRRLLAQGVDIRWNKSVKELSQTDSGVRVEFEDGETFDADHVLGADGSESKVRELLLGFEKARPRQSGFLFATGITKFGDADKSDAVVQAHPVAALMMGASSVGAVGGMLSTALTHMVE
jgi:flavin-dependent dehydrogenase